MIYKLKIWLKFKVGPHLKFVLKVLISNQATLRLKLKDIKRYFSLLETQKIFYTSLLELRETLNKEIKSDVSMNYQQRTDFVYNHPKHVKITRINCFISDKLTDLKDKYNNKEQ